MGVNRREMVSGVGEESSEEEEDRMDEARVEKMVVIENRSLGWISEM